MEANVVFPAKGILFSEVKHQEKIIMMNFMVKVQ
jgi:hypothetical protein